MIVLGIESSCDETAAAVVRDDGTVLCDVISSQVALHAPYGGVVPELASRAHMKNLVHIVQRAMADAPGGLDAVEAVAVTNGPGLVGALLVGVQAAKAIAWARSLPIVGVNHLVGHLLSAHLRFPQTHDRIPQTHGHIPPENQGKRPQSQQAPAMPYVALLASGGHTALYEVRSPLDVEQLGQTRDDAAGEAFDKVAKLAGLGYPGGPIIDKLAQSGDPKAVKFPLPMAWRGNLDFSFSGLKTAVAQHIAKCGIPETDRAMTDLCASFQRAVVEVLVRKSVAACTMRRVSRLVLVGGVAANRGLRERATAACAQEGIQLCLPPARACTDNAAMIAYAGACRLQAGERDGLDLNIFSRSPILGAKADSPALRRYKSSKLPRARS